MKTIYLDLDETLIYSLPLTQNQRGAGGNIDKKWTLIQREGEKIVAKKREKAEEIISRAKELAPTKILTRAKKLYAESLIETFQLGLEIIAREDFLLPSSGAYSIPSDQPENYSTLQEGINPTSILIDDAEQQPKTPEQYREYGWSFLKRTYLGIPKEHLLQIRKFLGSKDQEPEFTKELDVIFSKIKELLENPIKEYIPPKEKRWGLSTKGEIIQMP